MPKVVAEKANIADVNMKINVASQKHCRRDHGSDHAGAMRGDSVARDHVSARDQQHRAGSV